MTATPFPFEQLDFEAMPASYAVCRFDAAAPLPEWACTEASFLSVTRTDAELSVVIDERCLPRAHPDGMRAHGDWVGWRVRGTLEFELVGILAAITTRLADAGVSVFAMSTFETDYVLVQKSDRDQARVALNIS